MKRRGQSRFDLECVAAVVSYLCVSGAIACSGNDSQGSAVSTSAQAQGEKPAPLPPPLPPLPTDAPPAARVVHAYLAIAESLAADDAASAKSAFGALAKESTGAPDGLGARLMSIAQTGSKTSDIAEQRKHFELASEAVIELVSVEGSPLAEALRLVRCPMAFDNRGARWLQRGETIRNPYFGASMLSCGSVLTTYSADASGTPK